MGQMFNEVLSVNPCYNYNNAYCSAAFSSLFLNPIRANSLTSWLQCSMPTSYMISTYLCYERQTNITVTDGPPTGTQGTHYPSVHGSAGHT